MSTPYLEIPPKKPRPKSRLGVILLFIFFGLVAIGALNDNKSPPTTVDPEKDKAAWKYASVQIAEKNIKYLLKDAESAQFREVGVIIPAQLNTKTMGVVCGEVNAKNGFGGYTGYKKFVVLAGIPIVDSGDRAFANVWNKSCAHRSIEYPPQW